MPVYWMVAPNQKRDGSPNQVPVGGIRAITFNFNGPQQAAMQYARAAQYGTPGVDYRVVLIPPNDPTNMVLAVEVARGLAPGQLSGAGVQGAQPGAPGGQRGANRPDGIRDEGSKFQTLGDMSLGAGADGMYGNDMGDESTWTDLVQGGGVAQEIPRQG